MDASVAVKWLIPEDDQHKALEIRHRYQEANLNVIAPGLLVAEIGNALAKLVRRGLLTGAAAERAMFRFQRDAPVLRDSPIVNATALRLAITHNRTVYDCLYLALALHHECELITADEKFARAVQPVFQFVRLLKNYVPAGR